jgi:hypothetical protein
MLKPEDVCTLKPDGKLRFTRGINGPELPIPRELQSRMNQFDLDEFEVTMQFCAFITGLRVEKYQGRFDQYRFY